MYTHTHHIFRKHPHTETLRTEQEFADTCTLAPSPPDQDIIYVSSGVLARCNKVNGRSPQSRVDLTVYCPPDILQIGGPLFSDVDSIKERLTVNVEPGRYATAMSWSTFCVTSHQCVSVCCLGRFPILAEPCQATNTNIIVVMI